MKQEGLMFPKNPGKKRKKHHPKSILHDKTQRTCYLCMAHGDYRIKSTLHEHHIFPGNPNRRHCEEYGLKVYLCPDHHQYGVDSVHRDPEGENNVYLQRRGQQAFEQKYGHERFMEVFGKNRL